MNAAKSRRRKPKETELIIISQGDHMPSAIQVKQLKEWAKEKKELKCTDQIRSKPITMDRFGRSKKESDNEYV